MVAKVNELKEANQSLNQFIKQSSEVLNEANLDRISQLSIKLTAGDRLTSHTRLTKMNNNPEEQQPSVLSKSVYLDKKQLDNMMLKSEERSRPNVSALEKY